MQTKIKTLHPDELEKEENQWRMCIADFVEANQQEIAALDWGLRLERPDLNETLGIDLEPAPHFICCPKEAIVKLNRKVNNALQEIIGLVEGNNPEKEVLLLATNKGQIKVVQFETDPPPPACFEQMGVDVDTLLVLLERRLTERLEG